MVDYQSLVVERYGSTTPIILRWNKVVFLVKHLEKFVLWIKFATL